MISTGILNISFVCLCGSVSLLNMKTFDFVVLKLENKLPKHNTQHIAIYIEMTASHKYIAHSVKTNIHNNIKTN